MRSGRGSHGAHRKARGKLVRLAATQKRHAAGEEVDAKGSRHEKRPLKQEKVRRRGEPGEESQGDETSRRLQDSGVYHIRDRDRYAQNDSEGPKFSSPVTYSFWSGAKYCLMLSLLLWWFPLVGNMIAGYVGGRRAGGPWRGALACLFPIIVILILQYGYDHNLLPNFIVFAINLPAHARTAIATDLPAVVPYYNAAIIYVAGFVTYLSDLLRFQMNLYIVTIIFGYVGGAVAEIRRAEYALAGSSESSSNSNSNVTVNVHSAKAAAEEEGIAARRSRAEEDYLPPAPHRPTIMPVAVAGLPNWRRRRLPGEARAEREARGRERGEREARREKLGLPPLPEGESARESYFRIDSVKPAAMATPATAMAARARRRAREEDDEQEAERIPKTHVRAHTPVAQAHARARREEEDEAEDAPAHRSSLRERAVAAAPPREMHAIRERREVRAAAEDDDDDDEDDEEEEPRALPARAVRRVPKLERGAGSEMQRAAPRLAAEEHAKRVLQKKKADDDDDADDDGEEGEEETKGGDDEPVADRRKDEIQKLVERALRGTGPVNFEAKKEQEHNWEVL